MTPNDERRRSCGEQQDQYEKRKPGIWTSERRRDGCQSGILHERTGSQKSRAEAVTGKGGRHG